MIDLLNLSSIDSIDVWIKAIITPSVTVAATAAGAYWKARGDRRRRYERNEIQLETARGKALMDARSAGVAESSEMVAGLLALQKSMVERELVLITRINVIEAEMRSSEDENAKLRQALIGGRPQPPLTLDAPPQTPLS